MIRGPCDPSHFMSLRLRPYRAPVLPAPLDVGFETYVPKSATEEEPAPLKDVLDALAHRKVDPRAHHFVTCRGVAKSVPLPTGHAPLCEPIRFLRDSILGRDGSLAAGVPRRGCGGSLVPAQGR